MSRTVKIKIDVPASQVDAFQSIAKRMREDPYEAIYVKAVLYALESVGHDDLDLMHSAIASDIAGVCPWMLDRIASVRRAA